MTYQLSQDLHIEFANRQALNEDCRLAFELIRMFRLYEGNAMAFLEANPSYKSDARNIVASFQSLARHNSEEIIEFTMEIIKNA